MNSLMNEVWIQKHLLKSDWLTLRLKIYNIYGQTMFMMM